MRNERFEASERLIRVRTIRRGTPVEILVHYGREHVDGCDTYQLFVMEDVE